MPENFTVFDFQKKLHLQMDNYIQKIMKKTKKDIKDIPMPLDDA